MDFLINRMKLLAFLTKARLGGIVKDLHINTDVDKIVAKFADQHRTMYGEVYESDVTIKEHGHIDLGSIDQLISTINRSTEDSVRIKLKDNIIIVTDGSAAGKFQARISTIGLGEFVESWQSHKDKRNHFDKDTLDYIDGKYHYETGYEVSYEVLTELLRDAKAFGFENYMFSEKDGILNCTITNLGTKDTFRRRLITIGKISSKDIPSVSVGYGFRESITCLEKESADKGKLAVKLYFTTGAVLITNGVSYFINIQTKD